MRNVDEITPIAAATDARDLAVAAYAKLLTLLGQLDPQEWTAQTECPAWTVSDMVGHLIGAARATASTRDLLRQQTWAMRHKREFAGNDLDAMNALQVRDHANLGSSQRIDALRAIYPKAVRGRMRFPRPLRRIRVPLAQSGSTAQGMPTSLHLGHLMDVIYTRDVWLHRVDIAMATGHDLDLDQVDGRVVEDVVAEWAGRHGRPFQLTLTGPAGGEFRAGDDGESLKLDAVEFCRVVSGRAPGEGLLATRVLF